jgi:aldehyde dehydrogenase (NAD+)
MNHQDLDSTIERLRTTVLSGTTRPAAERIKSLKILKATIKDMESEIFAALKQDLGKSSFDSFASEVAFLYAEISHVTAKLHRWVKPTRVPTPLLLQPAKSYSIYEPKGVVLILGAWNYPFQLVMSPLIAALAAGNTVVVKPSEMAPATEAVIRKLIDKALPKHLGICICGGPELAKELVKRKFGHIFFTGSTNVGREIMRAAAENLTPVTLELGGKSPCIVDCNVDVAVTARRIVWGKFYNAGQTCVAPDYVLVHSDVRDSLVSAITGCIRDFFGSNPEKSEHYGRIINERHFDRLISLLSSGTILSGGTQDRQKRYMEPTLLEPKGSDAAVMAEEIFGPILPILTFDHLDDAIELIRSKPAPLACYAFSTNKKFLHEIQTKLSFGGGCFNATLLHLANPDLPFGGVGLSGLGRYHGKAGFTELSNQKSILADSLRFDLKSKYPPYLGGWKLLRLLMR